MIFRCASDGTMLFSQSESAQKPNCIINHSKISSTQHGQTYWRQAFSMPCTYFVLQPNFMIEQVTWHGDLINNQNSSCKKRCQKLNKKFTADSGNNCMSPKEKGVGCTFYHNTLRACHTLLGTLQLLCTFLWELLSVFVRKELGKSLSLFLRRILPVYR